MMESERYCKKCWRTLKVYVTCYQCDAIYHPKCLAHSTNFFVNEQGLMFCCGDIREEKLIVQSRGLLENIKIEENEAGDNIHILNEKLHEENICRWIEKNNSTIEYQPDLKRHKTKRNICKDSNETELMDLNDSKGNIQVLNEKPHEERLTENNDSTNENQFICSLCKKRYHSRNSLNNHMRAMHFNKKYKCPECSFASSWWSSLKMHGIAKHCKGQSVLKCYHCDYTTKVKKQLSKHMYTHMTDKPYKCQYENCSFQSSAAHRLREHVMRVHTFEKPFQCDICGSKFLLKCNLKSHVYRNHSKHAFKKDLCINEQND